MNMSNEIYGAALEMGIVEAIEDGKYRVASFTRYGISTPFIKSISQEEITVGDKVFYFIFPAGNGAILAKI